jgi:type II secretion system protein N
MKKKKVLLYAGYVLLFAAAIAIFIIHGIDGEAFREKLQVSLKDKTGSIIVMKRLDLSIPFSVTMEDFDMSSPDGRYKFHLDSFEIRPVYWKLLLFSPTMRFVLRANEGWLSLDVSPAFLFGKRNVSLESNKFPLEKVLVTVGGSPFPISVLVNAEVKYSAPRSSPADAAATAFITLEDINLKSSTGMVSLLSGLAPKKAKCTLEIKERKLLFKECLTSSPMGEAELRVSSKLLDDPENSQLTGALVLNPKEKLGDALVLLYLRFRKPDGAYYFPVTGTLNNPNLAL